MALVTICPDCWQGKHGACEGDAWDNDNDRPAICACWAENHKNGATDDPLPADLPGGAT
jgi:hypothetical protein